MRFGRRRAWTAIVVALPLLAWACYTAGLNLWGMQELRSARAALEERQFALAETHLKKVESVWPADATVHLLLAQSARRRGDWATAPWELRLCEQRKGPRDSVALERRLLRVQRGDLHDADALMTQCDAQPDAPQTPLILEALIEGSLKELAPAGARGMTFGDDLATPALARARAAVDKWLAMRPGRADRAQGLYWRGRFNAFANEQSQALADLRQALELDPDHFEARFYLAKFLSQDAPADAATQLQMLHTRFPENVPVRLWLASNCRTLGKLDDARQILDAVLAADPANVFGLLERGQIALDLQNTADAEEWLRRAHALAPNDPKINLALSSCLQMAGKPGEAQTYRERAQQIEADLKRKRAERVRQAGSMSLP